MNIIMRIINHHGLKKGFSLKFPEDYRLKHTHTHTHTHTQIWRRKENTKAKCCKKNNNQDDDNSPAV